MSFKEIVEQALAKTAIKESLIFLLKKNFPSTKKKSCFGKILFGNVKIGKRISYCGRIRLI